MLSRAKKAPVAGRGCGQRPSRLWGLEIPGGLRPPIRGFEDGAPSTHRVPRSWGPFQVADTSFNVILEEYVIFSVFTTCCILKFEFFYKNQ